jgi:division protein CdvB (Snf7/Vps24/ESCRT-III family)
MEIKPRKGKVKHSIKNLLDSEIPEIQSIANKLAGQIKGLEEQSSRLQEYISQIEHMATEEANTLVEGRISQILKDLDAAIKELRQSPKRALAASPEVRAMTPKRVTVEEKPEQEEEAEEAEKEIAPGPGMQLERVITPEGYVIKKVHY